jgi:hypothetical protein
VGKPHPPLRIQLTLPPLRTIRMLPRIDCVEIRVRWRWDNLVMDGAGDRQFQAARCLVSLAKNSRAVRTLRLDRGDALLMDNRCVLHGRRGFEDRERQLYRIRFWELGA